jgi:hypothetical protein
MKDSQNCEKPLERLFARIAGKKVVRKTKNMQKVTPQQKDDLKKKNWK